MNNATLYLNPEAYDTSGKALMGRHSAGESFLKGYLAHADVTEHVFWNVARAPLPKLQAMCEALGPVRHPITWINRENRSALRQLGVVNFPTPHLAKEAWPRRFLDPRAYAICGITHTTATHRIMDALGNMMIAPVESWDALICTSRAVRASVETQLEAVKSDLQDRLGAKRFPEPQIATIPLGINTSDFRTNKKDRAAWRKKLNIADDVVVALYVGRFNAHAKMNPAPMAQALERAVELTGKKIAWVLAGWGEEKVDELFHEPAQKFCPSVQYIVLDGRKPEVRFSIWSVGDFFLSLSDNIQETFGLTPLEAMAAGLPNVVSDWDGYRDTVRHGVDGFRISTYAPPPGAGQDFAFRYANEWIPYGAYVSAAAQVTTVDVEEAARAVAQLVENPELRGRMGRAAQYRAMTMFDWSAVIPQYQALWAEQNARRVAALKGPAKPRNMVLDPWRMDPFQLFASYPTEFVTENTVISLQPNMSWQRAQEILKSSLASTPGFALPTMVEADALVARLSRGRQMSVRDLVAEIHPSRRPYVQRGVTWLAKYNIIQIHGRSSAIPD